MIAGRYFIKGSRPNNHYQTGWINYRLDVLRTMREKYNTLSIRFMLHIIKGMDGQEVTAKLNMTSSEFTDGTDIPKAYGCKGQNINPPLAFSGIPDGAKSLALTLNDPDAPSGNFIHWLVWDIPVSTKAINSNSVPVGAVQGKNGSGQNQYMGPCPPSGTHHYIFTLYALDGSLSLPTGSNWEQLQAAMNGHIIAQVKLTGLFSA